MEPPLYEEALQDIAVSLRLVADYPVQPADLLPILNRLEGIIDTALTVKRQVFRRLLDEHQAGNLP